MTATVKRPKAVNFAVTILVMAQRLVPLRMRTQKGTKRGRLPSNEQTQLAYAPSKADAAKLEATVLLAFAFMASGICLLYPRLPIDVLAVVTRRTNGQMRRYHQRWGEWLLMSRILGLLLIGFGAVIGWTG